MKKIIIFLIACMLFVSTIAQISTREHPASFSYKPQPLTKNNTCYKILPKLNLKQINEEDIVDEENGRPPRFGFKHKVNFNMHNSGKWTTLASGDKIWRLSILCPDALSINLLYDKFWLPEDSKLFVYNTNKEHYIGAFTSKNNTGTKENPTGFATGLVYGKEIVVEYFQPKEVVEQAIISIDYVVHGYRYINVGTSKGFGDSNNCNININCPEGNNWQNEKNAVALILVNGDRICTGSLINNTAQDYTPYFLTAEHCLCNGDYDAESNPNLYYHSFYWHYEHPGCSNSSTEPLTNSTVGATVVANYWESDFALLELTEDPFNDPNITLYYLGWDKSGNSGTSAACIHHPKGDVKKNKFRK
ncbi:MAG: hypothetical protein PHW82_14535 [Bacteroidales bacterium]|nr:hypothetical protein [Bacteroidales bacterium]